MHRTFISKNRYYCSMIVPLYYVIALVSIIGVEWLEHVCKLEM